MANVEINPFYYKSGEEMTPVEVLSLFSDPPGFESYKDPSKHCIIVGSKGSGKSILLRSLSVSVQILNKKLEDLNFCGIYIERLIQANKFVEYNKKFEMQDIFEHFYVLVILSSIVNQLSIAVSVNVNKKATEFIKKRFLEKIFVFPKSDSKKNKEIFSQIYSLNELIPFIDERLQDLLNTVSPERNSPKDYDLITFWKLGGLLKFLKDFYYEIKPFPKLCLLIDGFEDLEELGMLIINNLVRHEYQDFLCIKIGTRRTYFDLTQLASEYERDFDISILDCDPNNIDHIEFLERFANRKIKVEWGLIDSELEAINIRTLLPRLKIPEIKNWDIKKSPAENYKVNNILKLGQSERTLRQKCFIGFDCAAKVAMVNPYVFLEICKLAYQEQLREGIDKTHPIINSKVQYESILKKSRRYRDIGISSKKEYSDYFLGISSFIYNVGIHLEKLQYPPNYEGTKIIIQVDELENKYKKVLGEAILSRDIFVDKKDKIISLIFNPYQIPNNVELNRLICPSFGLSWETHGEIILKESEIAEFIETPKKGDPDFHPFGHSSAMQIDLFKDKSLLASLHDESPSREPWVFGSGPYIERSKSRLNKIKKKVYELRKEKYEQSGRTTKEGIFYLDVWSLKEEYGGNYKHYILDAIKKSIYLVADIGGYISTGVAYEIGLAIGLNKPFFLYWDVKDIGKKFDSNEKKEWHPFLKEQDVREWNDEESTKKGISLKEWYLKNIDKHGQELSGKINCILEGFLLDKKCSYGDIIKNGIGKPYISFQAQNSNAEKRIIDFLAKSYKLYPINHSDFPAADPICYKCAAIRASSIQIIDASARENDKKGDPNLALELGLAYAIHKNKTIMCFNTDIQSDPVEMFPGNICAWHSATLDKDIEDNLENYFQGHGYGGIKL